jgi:hypothetical protein
MKKRELTAKLTRLVALIMMANLMMIPCLYAEGITIDGVVVEPEWTLFYKDEIYNPVYSLYTASDLDKIYLGIVLEDNNNPANVMIDLAFRAKNIDYWIQIKDGTIKYRPSGGYWGGWWEKIRSNPLTGIALPTGVTIAIDNPNGETSYEICISKDIMGGYVDDFPNNLKIWLKIVSEGETNIYPESYADWWFEIEQDEEEPEIIVPKFSVPELPFGTLLSLSTMVAALLIVSKKSLTHKL